MKTVPKNKIITSFLRKGQTLIELAVFGSILLFIVGSIVKQHLSLSYIQNQSYKAMRKAMLESYFMSNKGWVGKNTSSVLIVEDRLASGINKYGEIDRIPLINSAQSTHTRHLLMAVFPHEYDGGEHIALMDVFVNGDHFVFSLADWVDNEFKEGDIINGKPVEWEEFCFFCRSAEEEHSCGPKHCPGNLGRRYCEPECEGYAQGCPDCEPWESHKIDWYGCPVFYTYVPNHPGIEEWCDNTRPCPPDDGSGFWNIPLEQRFDLDRDGKVDVVDPNTQDNFAWQWLQIAGFHEVATGHRDFDHCQAVKPNPTGDDWRRHAIIFESPYCHKRHRYCISNKYDSIDVDGDMFEEKVINLAIGPGPAVKYLMYIDYQEGDVNFSKDPFDPEIPPGFTNDIQYFTFTRDGTYLLHEEGNLYNYALNPMKHIIGAPKPEPTQFVRSTQKRDNIDVIQRIFQLSNNKGTFCKEKDGVQVPTDEAHHGPNPVAACDECFSSDKVAVNCMDTRNNVIYMRSRLWNRKGRKLITPEDGFDWGTFDKSGGTGMGKTP